MATRYYRANAICLNEEALQRLPQDGNLTDIRSLQLGEYLHISVSHLKIYMEPTFPLHLFFMLHSRGQSKRLWSSSFKTYRVDHLTPFNMWPTIGGAPINEFTTEGYFSMAFPTLFPTGAADFLGQRCNQDGETKV